MEKAEFLTKYGFGTYPVTIIEHFWIPMKDGTRLAAKAWFPAAILDSSWFAGAKLDLFYAPKGASSGEKFPLILEYLPYRKSDFTAERDYRRHTWLASQGYVMFRVDIRGTGESEGLYFDEYLQQEQDDCMDVMDWVSDQPWSTGKIGMMGKSWGGFNGLQVAYCQPKQLKAVVSAYSTDDRYATDMHHDGGCVMDGLLSWASVMLVLNATCPDPRLVPDWQKMWRERLNHTHAWSEEWLRRQLYDDFWAHGSVCEDYSKVQCPVLLIGGWRDGYRDAVFRMVNKLPNCKAIVGPWPHNWPDIAKPGPNIEYLQIVQQWFDQHLKGMETSAPDEPKLRLYLQSDRPPGPSDNQPGRWIQMDGWPSEQVKSESFTSKRSSLVTCTSEKVVSNAWDKVPFSLLVGMNQGLWLQFGQFEGSPDQRLSDAYSLVYTTDELVEELTFVGFAEFKCKVKVTNHNQGALAVRLVDQFPTGESTLVTYGVLNLTHFQGHTADKVRYLEPEEELEVSSQLHSTSYVFPAGHKLKLCLSSCYWPICWPSTKCVDMWVSSTTLKLPLVKAPTEYKSNWFNVVSPKVGPPMDTKKLEDLQESIKLEVDFPGRRYKRTVTTGVTMPLTELGTLGVAMGNTLSEVAEVEEEKPQSAKLRVVHHFQQNYPDMEGSSMTTSVDTESMMWADDSHFHLCNKLKTTLNGQVFFEKEWKEEIQRLYV